MQELTSKQRKHLKAEAHHLHPLVHVGKLGLTDGVVEETKQALSHHELIKIKFVDHKDERKELAEQLAVSCEAVLVANLGNLTIFFKEHPEAEKRKHRLPN